MKTIDDLKRFYDTTLMPDLLAFEQQRRGIVRKITTVIIVALGLGGLSFVFMASNMRQVGPAVMIPFVLCLLIGGAVCSLLIRGYVAYFKTVVIEKIVHFIDDNLSYEPKNCIPKSTFMLSKIFTTKPNRYKGDDFVSGKVGATQMQFCELNAEYESGSGKDRHTYTVFRGIFFIADFNKHFNGQTIVLPDTAEKLFGRLGQKLQSLNVFRGELIRLEDPEFESHFVVYGSDQIEARYILSTSLMARITDFKKRTGKKIYLSFIGSMVFVAVPYTRNLFEPRLFKTLLDFEPIRRYYEDLQLAIGIVEDLNLNTRIWSKE
ncbi:MAG: DUF3137 domain-containing protein [Sedimentisphaerales bacterium]|nr:DUF3137 domain-containing protein [Sedimentisphaerales bacterium]